MQKQSFFFQDFTICRKKCEFARLISIHHTHTTHITLLYTHTIHTQQCIAHITWCTLCVVLGCIVPFKSGIIVYFNKGKILLFLTNQEDKKKNLFRKYINIKRKHMCVCQQKTHKCLFFHNKSNILPIIIVFDSLMTCTLKKNMFVITNIIEKRNFRSV